MKRSNTLQKEILNLVAEGNLTPGDAARLLRTRANEEVIQTAAQLPEIAVVGISGRFPDASDVDVFWENLLKGHDSVRNVPADRWVSEPNENTGAYCRRGGFLDSVEQFDPLFFDISPREAELMDPQQRLFLEEAYHAFEKGGFSQEKLMQSRCGVFVGATPGDYKWMLQKAGHEPEAFTLVGTNEAILAARISYLLNLKGPSLSVNTACSSSLVALTLACESLVGGNCDLAVAGGISIYSTPDFHISASRAGILSSDGRCKAFDDSADGFVPGEAVGVIILKRLADAEADGDHIQGVISAWGSNQDGRSNGITAPNAVSQTELIRTTYKKFGIDPHSIGYVEAHGTGTKLGDPIEIAALTDAFGFGRDNVGTCGIGSVKSNVGHTFAAAGITGLIKILGCLQHRRMVPSLHVRQTNRHIDFEESPFYVCRESKPWEVTPGQIRHAALNSFGFSGTNVHLVVREYTTEDPITLPEMDKPRLFTLSAKSPEALQTKVDDLIAWLESTPSYSMKDLSFSLCSRRSHYENRFAVVASNSDELRLKLVSGAKDLAHSRVRVGLGIEDEGLTSLIKRARVDSLSKEDLKTLVRCYVQGLKLPFDQLIERGKVLVLPGYPFQHERCWFTPETDHEIETLDQTSSLAGPVRAFRETIEALEGYARQRLVACMAGMGMPVELDCIWEKDSLVQSMGIDEGYLRLFDALLEILTRYGFVDRTGQQFRVLPPLANSAEKKFIDVKDLVQFHPDAKRYLPLLQACLDGLPDILTKRVNATQVMFPEGSMRLVKPTYQGDPIRDYFNGELADLVADALHRIEGEGRSLTLMEVGAGTGGTTVEVLRRIRHGKLDHNMKYVYTDISPSFISHGERTFGPEAPFMMFRALDIERRFEQQGFVEGEADIIFASNVVHAVRDVGSALRNLAKGLKPGGLLLLNEITATNDITTLTFGLTPGWWRAEDPTKRVPHSPLLSPEAWRKELLASGFASGDAHSLPFSEPKFEQRLFVAERDNEPVKQMLPKPLGVGAPCSEPESSESVQNDLEAVALEFVREQLGQTVKLIPARIQADKTFEVYGVDSLVVVELTKKLEEEFGNLPSTILFEHQTPRRLAKYFAREHSARIETLLMHREARNPAFKEAGRSIASPVQSQKSPVGDIAIVGLAGRYPDSPDLATFWDNLKQGRNCIREIPNERWTLETSSRKDGSEGEYPSRWGGFLEDVGRFDPLFFNIAPREAAGIDPQERLFLEMVWHLLEDAGYTPHTLNAGGARVGVFAGVMNSDYSQIAMDHKAASGAVRNRTAFWSVANRVSYVFDFQGPSFSVDSACSSSLTAIHLACQSLRLGESNIAVAGGVNLILHQSKYTELSRLGMLSSDDRCKPFSNEADGFVDGEGGGVVLLRPLSDAMAKGDRIYGIIKGSSINAGGKTSGYTVPNPNAQADLVERALVEAQITAADISYVEAHGTGTSLGDPIELAALTNAYRRFTKKRDYCAIGSVKSNIGHLESAAGIAGLTKVLLQMRSEELVPTIHCEELSPKLALEGTPFFVNVEGRPWLKSGQPLRAGISSFGAGGANAHLIVEQAPEITSIPRSTEGDRLVLLTARSKEDLRSLIRCYVKFVQKIGDEQLDDLCFTLQVGRVPQAYTLPFVVQSLDNLKNQLSMADRGFKSQDCLRPSREWNPGDHPVPDSNLMGKAQRWVDGESIDWLTLYSRRPSRIGLPVYPFGGRRFWIDSEGSNNVSMIQDKLVPPTESVQSGYHLNISADDMMVSHHRVESKPVMPGVGYVAALLKGRWSGLHPIHFTKLFWVSPLEVSVESEIFAEISENEGVSTFIFRDSDGRMLSHGAFEMQPGSGISPLCILEWAKKRQGRHFHRQEIDRLFKAVSIQYGPYFQTLREVKTFGGKEAVGFLKPASLIRSDWEAEGIHPAILDGALQVIGCLMAGDGQAMLPFSLGTVTFYCGFTNVVTVEARRTGRTSFDLDLRDKAGTLCVAIREFVVREIRDPVNTLLYIPHWKPVTLPQMKAEAGINKETSKSRLLLVSSPSDSRISSSMYGDEQGKEIVRLLIPERGFETPEEVIQSLQDCRAEGACFDHIVFLGCDNQEDTAEGLHAAERCGVLSLFCFFRALRGSEVLSAGTKIFLVTEGINSVFDGDKVQPWSAGMRGLGQSVAREFTDLSWHFVDLECQNSESEIDLVTKESWLNKVLLCPAEGEIALRGGRCYRRCLYPLSIPSSQGDVFRPHGVYLIAGGAGGIGFEFSKYLAETHQARFVWLGRSEISRHEKQIRIIQGLGGEVLYIRCDIVDRRAVFDAVESGQRRFGKIHGVFHSAIILRDQSLLRMEKKTLQEVLSVKTSGTQNLFHAVSELELDFFIFFSSAQSFVSNAGQGSYAAACAFKDAYALFMRQNASFPVKIVNWGYWGDVGIVSDEVTKRRMAERGIQSLSSREGIEVVKRLLTNEVVQVLPVRLSSTAAEAMGVDLTKGFRVVGTEVSKVSHLEGLTKIFPEPSLAAFRHAYDCLQKLGRLKLLNLFRDMGIFSEDSQVYSANEITTRLKVVPAREPLLSSCLEMLSRAKLISDEKNTFTLTPRINNGLLDELVNVDSNLADLIAKYPDISRFAELLSLCLASFNDVLNGRKSGTDVLFAGVSTHAVEGIYHDNPLAIWCNRLCAEMVHETLEQLSKDARGEPLRVLEIGAGTGGTSKPLLKTIRTGRYSVEYIYTDISSSFLKAGNELADEYSFVRTEILDVSSEMDCRRWSGAVDVVVASNVLHATEDLRNALRNAKRLLKPGGLLVLNELTERQDFTTLTFGLLDGWWPKDDIRIAHSPLLDRKRWELLSREEGLVDFQVLRSGDELLDLGQDVMTAVSDGIVLEERNVGDPWKPDYKSKSAGVNARTNGKFEPKLSMNGTRSMEADRARVRETVLMIVSDVLEIEPKDLQLDVPHSEFGVDSILAIEMVKKINLALTVDLQVTDFFNYSTIRELTEHLVPQIQGRGLMASGLVGEHAEPGNGVLHMSEESTLQDEQSQSDEESLLDIFVRVRSGELSVAEARALLQEGGFDGSVKPKRKDGF